MQFCWWRSGKAWRYLPGEWQSLIASETVGLYESEDRVSVLPLTKVWSGPRSRGIMLGAAGSRSRWRLSGGCSPAGGSLRLPLSMPVPVSPSAIQEPLQHEGEPAGAGRRAQPRTLEPEEQRAGGRPRRRRDLGSRLQAQRRAQRAGWVDTDENEEEVVVQGERWGRGVVGSCRRGCPENPVTGHLVCGPGNRSSFCCCCFGGQSWRCSGVAPRSAPRNDS